VPDLRREHGIALIVAVMAMLLMMALGIAVLLATTTETLISSAFRQRHEALYAADAIVERAMADLLTLSDWNSVLDGSVRSTFVDGSAGGTRTLADGSTIDLTRLVNMVNCQKTTACTGQDMDQSTAERPWGTNNPRWRLFAHGYLQDILPGSDTIRSPYYVLLLAADDPAETDNDPAKDGVALDNPGSGVLALRAEAFGPRGAHKVIDVTVARAWGTQIDQDTGPGRSPVRIVSWREIH
jgi:Tfp pilus assembly protein PilX